MANKRSDERYLQPREWARRMLRDRIISGEYRAGSYLPSERRLAEEMGVARMTLRAAIDRLVAEGLVERQPGGRGTLVVEGARKGGAVQIGVVHLALELTGWPEGATILRGVTDRLAELGYAAQVMAHGWYDGKPRHSHEARSTPVLGIEDLEKLHERVAGVVFVEVIDKQIQRCALALEERHFPVVVANLEHDLPLPATYVDHARYIRQAVEILISLGHRRIAYVGQRAPEIFYPSALRAYHEVMESHGLPHDESLLALTDTNSGAAAYRVVRAMLVAPQPPTAFVAARDLYAEGACHAIEDIGAEVGRDISVFGFDDISWQSRDPYITTFREPCHEMGAVAAEMIVERVTHGWRPIEKREIEAKLIMRRTVGPAPKHTFQATGAGIMPPPSRETDTG